MLALAPGLADCNELKMFMKQQGEMSNINKVKQEERELDEGEALWSSDSESDSDGDDFSQFNRMDASMKTIDTKSFKKSSVSPQKRNMGTL